MFLISFLFSSFVFAQPVFIELKDYPYKGPFQATLSSQTFHNGIDRFDARGDEEEVEVLGDHEPFPFKMWLHEDTKSPIIFILPGIASHHRASGSLRLAEMYYNQGYSVVTISDVFGFLFMERALTSEVPGYSRHDVKDLQRVIRKILDYIREEEEDVYIEEVYVTGFSLGGLHALFLADLEQQYPESAIGIKKFISINPPVDVQYSLDFLDKSYEIYKTWSVDERKAKYMEYVPKLRGLLEARYPQQQNYLVETVPEDVAQLAIGTVYRAQLAQVISVGLRLGKLDSLMERGYLADLNVEHTNWRRKQLYDAIEANYSYHRYMQDIVFPTYAQEFGGVPSEDLVHNSGLRSIEKVIRTHPGIRIFHNANDVFMVTSESLKWLGDVAGSKLTIFDHGGHVGNLYRPDVQAAILMQTIR